MTLKQLQIKWNTFSLVSAWTLLYIFMQTKLSIVYAIWRSRCTTLPWTFLRTNPLAYVPLEKLFLPWYRIIINIVTYHLWHKKDPLWTNTYFSLYHGKGAHCMSKNMLLSYCAPVQDSDSLEIILSHTNDSFTLSNTKHIDNEIRKMVKLPWFFWILHIHKW